MIRRLPLKSFAWDHARTISKLAVVGRSSSGSAVPELRVPLVVFSACGIRAAEAQRAAELFAGTSALQGPLLKGIPGLVYAICGCRGEIDIRRVKAAFSRPHFYS